MTCCFLSLYITLSRRLRNLRAELKDPIIFREIPGLKFSKYINFYKLDTSRKEV
jgi:hypothetical protein